MISRLISRYSIKKRASSSLFNRIDFIIKRDLFLKVPSCALFPHIICSLFSSEIKIIFSFDKILSISGV